MTSKGATREPCPREALQRVAARIHTGGRWSAPLRRHATCAVLVAMLVVSACGTTPRSDRPRTHPPYKLIVLSEAGVDPDIRAYDIGGERYYSLPEVEGFVQLGKASWYGKKFHGRATSSGEIYDMHRLTAAHKTLPLGTYVSVVNLTNGRETIVRINDRGPFVKGRVIDLSYGAAKEIGSVKPGVADVKVVALGRMVGERRTSLGVKPVVETRDLKRGGFTVQVGAFKDRENALSIADRLRVLFDSVEVSVHQDGELGVLYRVRVSKSDTLEEAARVEQRLEGMGFDGAFVVSI